MESNLECEYDVLPSTVLEDERLHYIVDLRTRQRSSHEERQRSHGLSRPEGSARGAVQGVSGARI